MSKVTRVTFVSNSIFTFCHKEPLYLTFWLVSKVKVSVVTEYVKSFPIKILRTIKYRALIIQLLSIPGENMSTGFFEFIWSKVKITRVMFMNNYVKPFPPHVLKTIDFKAFITHKIISSVCEMSMSHMFNMRN